MELKVTKERVLEAANACSTAKATLEKLFPEAFVVEKEYLLLKNLVLSVETNGCGTLRPFGTLSNFPNWIMADRREGKYHGKGILLYTGGYDFRIEREDSSQVLVITRK